MNDPFTLEAGFEIEGLVAQEILGWTWQVHVDCATLWKSPTEKMLVRRGTDHFEEAHWWSGGEMYGCRMPRFSREIDATWKVVEAIHALNSELFLVYDSRTRMWVASFNNDMMPPLSRAETAELAICRAALRWKRTRKVCSKMT
jgi:Phage ABA sandwich domain